MVTYFLCPYKVDPLRPRRRYCAIDDQTPTIVGEGGTWAESEVDGNQAVVRVRASTATINSLKLLYSELNESEVVNYTQTPRQAPYWDINTQAIKFTPQRKFTPRSIRDLVLTVRPQAISQELLSLINLWTVVGFGEGWRLPWHEIVRGISTGLPPIWGAAFPVTSVKDSFTRANETPLGNLTWDNPISSGWGTTGLKLVTNQAVGNAGGDSSWWTTQFSANQEVYVTYATTDTGGIGLEARLQSPGSGGAGGSGADSFEAEFTVVSGAANDTLKFWKQINATYTQIGSTQTPGDWAAGEKMGFEVIGTTLKAYRYTGGAWGAYGTTETNGDVTGAGYIGVGIGSLNNKALDDFGGGGLNTTFDAAVGSLTLSGIATVLRVGSTTWLRHRR